MARSEEKLAREIESWRGHTSPPVTVLVAADLVGARGVAAAVYPNCNYSQYSVMWDHAWGSFHPHPSQVGVTASAGTYRSCRSDSQ